MKLQIYFKIISKLGIKIRTTKTYWDYIVNIKHPLIKGKENIIKETLANPDCIAQSTIDNNVYLYYRKFDKLYCAVVRHLNKEGFLITAYPTDKVKEGRIVWTK